MIRTTTRLAILTAVTVFGPAHADELFDELQVCRDLPSDEARVICYDAAVDRGRQHDRPGPGPVAEAPATVTTEASTVPETGAAATEVSPEELFGKSGVEVQRTVDEAAGRSRVESLSAAITALRQFDYNKFIITLDNGQTWQQIDSSNLRLRVGDAIRIERASLGSYLLQKAGSKRTMRVSRRE